MTDQDTSQPEAQSQDPAAAQVPAPTPAPPAAPKGKARKGKARPPAVKKPRRVLPRGGGRFIRENGRLRRVVHPKAQATNETEA